LINRITDKAPVREKAFFSIMRQTELPAKTISQLRIRNIESNTIIPRKINFRHELNHNINTKIPCFIGEEASRYINQYLAMRDNLTGESLLFATRNNKRISTKNVNRTFKRILEKIENEGTKQGQPKNLTNSAKGNFSLRSLTAFYRANTKYYREAIKNNPEKYDYYYRKLYKEKALPFLEIEYPASDRKVKNRREFRKGMKYAHIVETANREMTKTKTRDNEFIGSILSLLYDNKGDFETRQNEVIGDNFVELWKEVRQKQHQHLVDAWGNREIKLLPLVDIVEELTKTLKRIKKPYDELEKQLSQIS